MKRMVATSFVEATLLGMYLEGRGVPKDYKEALHWFPLLRNKGALMLS